MDILKKIGIGSAQFGMAYGISNISGQTPHQDVRKILEYSQKAGIFYIDTAAEYGNAEVVLGNLDLSGFRIITKFMPPTAGSSIEEQLERSLERLRLDAVYGYLAHRPDHICSNILLWDKLTNLRKQGKVKKVGFSLNQPDELAKLLSYEIFPDIIQVPYNLLDQRFKSQMIKLKQAGCEIHTRSTFLQGLFFMDTGVLPSFFDEVKEIIHELQQNNGNHLSGRLLKYVLDLEFVDVVVMGINNLEQLKQNIECLRVSEPVDYEAPYVRDEILMPSLWPKNWNG